MKKNTEYKKTLKKYGTKGVLQKYLEGKIELNSREWNDLNIRIEMQQRKPKKSDIKFMAAICSGIIFIALVLSVGNYIDKKINCNNYEIKKMNVKKGE